MEPPLPQRLRRTLGRTPGPSRAVKSVLLLAAFVAAAWGATRISRTPDLAHVDVAILSGSAQGNYYAIVAKLADEAKRRRGRIANLASAGTVENITRLAAAKAGCEIQFALVQDGVPWPESHSFELIGRLPTFESLVVLGRDADRIHAVADMRGMRVGIGPIGSGTEHLARQVVAQVAELDLKVSTHPIAEQLELLVRGDLDLGAMVIERDAAQIVQAVRDRKLQVLDFAGADAVASKLPSARPGIIRAGHYDPVQVVPPTDKRVIDVDTLLIGNGCARESVTQGVISAMTGVFPDFVRTNRERPNLTGLPYATASRTFIDEGGPDIVGAHVPWVIDIMPMSRWVQLVFGFSMLFAAQALWHRFRLWRLDAARVGIESEVGKLFPTGLTIAEIGERAPDEAQRTPAVRARVDALIDDLVVLSKRARKQSLSMLVPMGQEMAYRYQEQLVADLLDALRAFRGRLDA